NAYPMIMTAFAAGAAAGAFAARGAAAAPDREWPAVDVIEVPRVAELPTSAERSDDVVPAAERPVAASRAAQVAAMRASRTTVVAMSGAPERRGAASTITVGGAGAAALSGVRVVCGTEVISFIGRGCSS